MKGSFRNVSLKYLSWEERIFSKKHICVNNRTTHSIFYRYVQVACCIVFLVLFTKVYHFREKETCSLDLLLLWRNINTTMLHLFSLHNYIMITSYLPRLLAVYKSSQTFTKSGLLKWFHNFLLLMEIVDKTACPKSIFKFNLFKFNQFNSSKFSSFKQFLMRNRTH